MGIAILVVSILAFFTLSNGPMMNGFQKMLQSHARPVVQPPARKSMIVDADGYAHRTADNTQMTKRDRSRILPPPEPVAENLPSTEMPLAPATVTNDPVASNEIKFTPGLDVGYKYAEEQTTSVSQKPSVEDLAEPSISQKIATTLAADPALSESARVTLKTNYRDGLVILYGIVTDEKEKSYLAERARGISGVKTVENQLHTMNEYTVQTSK